MITKKESDKIKRLITAVVQATVNLSWTGTAPPEEKAFFKQELVDAKRNLRNFLKSIEE